jgi:hypothetical protein
MNTLVGLLGVEQLSPRVEAPLVELQRLGRQTFNLDLKLTDGEGSTTPAARVPAAGAHREADASLRRDRQDSRPALPPDPQRDILPHSLTF